MLIAVVLGVALGAAAQAVYGLGSPAIADTLPWVGIVGTGYVRLLQMVIAPLVLVSILAAVTKLNNARSLGAISGSVLGLLLVTTAISALIGIGMTQPVRPAGRWPGPGRARTGEGHRPCEGAGGRGGAKLTPSRRCCSRSCPVNIFADLAGTRSTSVIGVVIFAALLGLAALSLRKEKPEIGERVLQGIDTFQHLIMRLVRIVIRLTPYGVLASDGQGGRHLQRQRRHQSRRLRHRLLSSG